MPNEPIRIKRYPNRRFYASHTSKYVSLSEIEQMIRDGADVEIIDSASGGDITRVILIQMIAEQQPEKITMFPTAMLHVILRANGAMARSLQEYFRNSLAYLEYFQSRHISDAAPEPMDWMKAWLGSWPPWPGNLANNLVDTKATASDPPPKESDVLAERIAELEQRIAELEQQRSAPV